MKTLLCTILLVDKLKNKFYAGIQYKISTSSSLVIEILKLKLKDESIKL